MPVLSLAACGSSSDEGKGTVQIFVVPEASIAEGLDPGTGPENVHDGWTIRYTRYLAVVGNFRAARSDTGDRLLDPTTYVLDLRNAPTSGYVAHEWKDVAAVRWDKFGYDVANAKSGAVPLPPTTQADADFMIAKGYSVYFEGYGEKESDKISFAWGFAAGTSFDDCASEDGIAGFAVPAGGSVQIKPTLHGDHQYFDNVTQGVEKTQRLAQWLLVCDADGDRALTLDELSACDAAKALPSPDPYDLTAVKDVDGDRKISVYDYVHTQLRTFGDYQGDGECPSRLPLP
ncbi:MAG TPA: hypothetical protein VJT73_11785 [Polyangiaceae bacterium]|nr:hypothetical protein [Polyangiaceae bacterium]